MSHVNLFVEGTPRPQGSKRIVRGRLVESSKDVYEWRERIAYETRQSRGTITYDKSTAVHLTLVFYFKRPQSHLIKSGISSTAPQQHVRTPDLDKLIRAVGDALTMSGVWEDDSQVTQIRAEKQWSTEHSGVFISIEPHETLTHEQDDNE